MNTKYKSYYSYKAKLLNILKLKHIKYIKQIRFPISLSINNNMYNESNRNLCERANVNGAVEIDEYEKKY